MDKDSIWIYVHIKDSISILIKDIIWICILMKDKTLIIDLIQIGQDKQQD